MLTARVILALSLLALAAAAAAPRHRRQLADEDTLQPLEEASGAELDRDKRKFEGVTQAKFSIKNAILGFVFGKINSIIDAKTRLVENLDKQNIEINKQYGIEAPAGGGLGSITGAIGQALAPKLQLVSGLLGGASGASVGGGGHGDGHGGGGSGSGGLGSILSLVTSLSGSSSGGGNNAGATVDTIDSSEEDDS